MVPEGWTDGKIHKVNVQPDTDDLETDLCFDLLFQHTDTYPETAPNLKVSNPRGLSNANVEALTRALVACAEENVGMASVFTVMQAGKDWLESKAGIEEGAASVAVASMHCNLHVLCNVPCRYSRRPPTLSI